MGRKIFIHNLFLPPLQGSTLLPNPTPGSRPGLFSLHPSRACLNGRVNLVTEAI